jgi:hypothetical protein
MMLLEQAPAIMIPSEQFPMMLPETEPYSQFQRQMSQPVRLFLEATQFRELVKLTPSQQSVTLQFWTAQLEDLTKPIPQVYPLTLRLLIITLLP